MERMRFEFDAPRTAQGAKKQVLTGVVASGNLEVLLERTSPPARCVIEVATAAHGFGEIWKAVLTDVVARYGMGGLRVSINDGGARPDTVALRLAQGVRLIEEGAA